VAVSFSATFRATLSSDAAGQLAGRGVSISDTARRFGVNRSTVGRYLRRLDEGGSLAPKKAPGPPSKLDESAMRLLEDDVKARPGATQPDSKTSFREDLLAAIHGKGCVYTRLSASGFVE
jgi:transposase